MDKTNLSAEMADAAAEAARVVQNIPDTKSLDDPSLCGDWDLRTLLNHLILWTSYSAERRAYGESAAEDLMSRDFTADPGFREDYAKQLKKAVDAWSAPQAWEGTRDMMGTATPATDIGAMLIMEMALHGWDVARATGQEYHATDALAAVVEETVKAQAELFRQYQGFADAVETANADATAFDRALALSGRDPN
ncbi:MAG TPA: TIGR03086 family metal-binding protein [Streptosporangiaceae bacterium]|nr:TIGR03086 family metal-binding protein [Streptosporangiaceae bacterium]